MKYYLIGIKGSGMSALAKILLDQKHIVRGYDLKEDFFNKDDLKNITIDNTNYFNKDYIYIIGNAFINHPFVKELKEQNFKTITYPKFINTYFSKYKIISISGTHGKTTTCKFLATLLQDTSYLIGDGSGNGLNYEKLILESCEYKDTFLNYYPDYILILNVSYDHPDYFKSKKMYVDSFKKFINQGKKIILNADDKNLKKIQGSNIISYGIDNGQIRFKYIENDTNSIITINNSTFVLPFIGKHIAYDFVGAYLLSKMFNIDDQIIQERIKNLKFPRKRFELHIINGINFYLDYAHHPEEIRCVYNSLRSIYKKKSIICFFQLHTISRAYEFLYEFKEVLSKFEKTYMFPLYLSIRENYDNEKISFIYKYLNFTLINNLNDIKFTKENIYVFLGAGNIDNIFYQYIKEKLGN